MISYLTNATKTINNMDKRREALIELMDQGHLDVRDKFKEMVEYLLKVDDTDDKEVIDNYTDSLMEGAREYYNNKASDLLSDLINQSEENISVSGLRFEGTNIVNIKQIFDKHGITFEYQF